MNHYGEQQKGYCAATEKYEFCCYLSDMGVERIYTVLAENEKELVNGFMSCWMRNEWNYSKSERWMKKDERRKLLYRYGWMINQLKLKGQLYSCTQWSMAFPKTVKMSAPAVLPTLLKRLDAPSRRFWMPWTSLKNWGIFWNVRQGMMTVVYEIIIG